MCVLNELTLGVVNAALGLVGVAVSSMVAYSAGKKAEKANRERLILELGLEEHKLRTELALRIAKENKKDAYIYPSFFAIRYVRSMIDIIFSAKDDKGLMEQIAKEKERDKTLREEFRGNKENE